MRLLLCFLTIILGVLAADSQQKTYLVSYQNEAPESVLDQAKSAIEAAVRLTFQGLTNIVDIT